MRIASVIARYLAGVIFLVMGLNGFLHFIPFPPPAGVAGQFMGALYVSHYLWVIFAFQVVAGALLLVNRYVPLAVALLAPVIVNILTFHALMAPSGLTSVGSANLHTGVPHFDSKYEVERHIAKIGVRATILAPVAFMENLFFVKEQLAKGIYASAVPPARPLAQVAVADIGVAAVRVLEDAGRFTGKRIELAGDELSGDDAMAILARVTARSFTYFQIPLDVVWQRMGEDAVRMYEWFDRVGFAVDRAALRREFPDVAFHDFESWAKTRDWIALLQSA